MNFKKIAPILMVVFIAMVFMTNLSSMVNVSSSQVINWKEVDNNAKDMNYTTFMNKIQNKEIKTIYAEFNDFDYSKTFYVILDKKVYTVNNLNTDEFKETLYKNDIVIKNKVDIFEKVGLVAKKQISYTWIFSFCIYGVMIFFFFTMFKNMQNVNGIQQDKIVDKNLDKQNDKKTFDDVGGLKELKHDLISIVDFLKNGEKYKKANATLPKGCLLIGPPGTGKTLLAKVVANEAGVPFLYMNGSDFVEMFVGRGAARVRDLFKEARKQAPCIVFIDEIDSLCGKRGTENSSHSEDRKTLTALLAEMDGFKDSNDIIVFGATNRVEDLDPAVLRPGRFTEIYNVPVPETNDERLEVIKIYAKDKNFDETVDLNIFSKEMIGRSPAEIEAVLNEAAIISVQKNIPYINKDCLEMAFYKRIMRGHMKDNKETHPDDLKTIAYHEAGHTLINKLTNQEVTKVTIIPSTSGAGGVTFIQPGEEKLYSKEKLKNRILGMYGGRAAEYILFNNDENKVTTGAYNDIEQATKLLYAMVDTYGFYENGPVNMSLLKNTAVTDKSIDSIILLAKQYQKEAINILEENKDTLKRLADVLLEKETLYEDEIDEIINEKGDK